MFEDWPWSHTIGVGRLLGRLRAPPDRLARFSPLGDIPRLSLTGLPDSEPVNNRIASEHRFISNASYIIHNMRTRLKLYNIILHVHVELKYKIYEMSKLTES
jgi:hypothetical protein